MATIDPFKADSFTLTELTAAIATQPFKPGRIAALGLFEEAAISTTSVIVDELTGVLSLVPTSPRGGAATPHPRPGRASRSFIAPHIAKRRMIMADELQNVRAFGMDTAETINMVRDQILASMKQELEATIEWHRVGAIKGLILDADASSVIYNLFTEFNLSQQTEGFLLTTSTTKVRNKISAVLKMIEDELGNAPFRGVRAFCGQTFWDTLIEHDAVKATYLNSQYAADLRNDPRETVTFGGITFERYRGSVGGTAFVADDDAYAFPEGVPGMFITRFAPADYVETVNTLGLPVYAKSVLDEMGKGMEIEAQSNPLSICTRPRAVIKLTKV
jgi:hypothetical protein